MSVMTLGQVAEWYGVRVWQVQRLADLGRLPVSRAGRLRVVNEDDLPAVEAELRRAGYLPAAADLAPPP